MSRIRVLVGTKKGAFILSSDGKRQKWNVSGPHFSGWEIYHMKGSPVDPNRIFCFADQRLVWAGDSAIRRRRQDVDYAGQQAGGADIAGRHAQGGKQQVRLRHRATERQAADDASVVRRHAARVGIQARVARRAVAE